MRDQRGTRFIIGLLVAVIFTGCSSKEEPAAESSFETITIAQDQLKPFVTFEEDSIAQPTDMVILPNGNRAILDYDLKSVLMYNENGELQGAFGREGKGPGEFVRPTAIDHTAGHMYVNDQGQNFWQKFTLDGEYVNSIQNIGGGFMDADIEIINDGEFLVPADGKHDALIQYKNINTDSSFYFGAPMGDSTTVVNLQENASQARKGEISDIFKNMVYLAPTRDAYYAFLKSYGRLQKYDHSGNLLWETELDLPFMDTVFEEYVEANQNQRQGTLRMLVYAYDMQATADHVYLLMYVPEEQPQALIEVDTDGNITKRYNLTYPDSNFNAFAISDSGDELYLIDTSLGRVYSMSLPPGETGP